MNRDLESAIEIIGSLAKKGFIPCSGKGPSAPANQLASELGSDSAQNLYIGPFKVFSARENADTRMTLMAQVADWSKSRIKSSQEMLHTYGYSRDGRMRLNCTLKFEEPNTQGLYLGIDNGTKDLIAWDSTANSKPIEVWSTQRILKRLEEKHGNALMVTLESKIVAGVEYIRPIQVTHYGTPDLDNFENLVKNGSISIDHLISESDAGGAHEKGPLLKLDRSQFQRLFRNPTVRHLL